MGTKARRASEGSDEIQFEKCLQLESREVEDEDEERQGESLILNGIVFISAVGLVVDSHNREDFNDRNSLENWEEVPFFRDHSTKC